MSGKTIDQTHTHVTLNTICINESSFFVGFPHSPIVQILAIGGAFPGVFLSHPDNGYLVLVIVTAFGALKAINRLALFTINFI